MKTSLESSGSSDPAMQLDRSPSRLRMGAAAAFSLLAGGLVAAWWYRKTLKKLHQVEIDAQNPHFGILDDNPVDEP
jgi:hypothetical protein